MENLQVEVAQPGTRLDAQIAAKQRPDLLIRVQRIGLPTGAVEGDHQQFSQPLAQWVFVDQSHQLRDYLVVAAHLEVEGDPFLERRQPNLVQSIAFLLDELAMHTGQRIVPPQRQRCAQQSRSPGYVAGRASASSRRDLLFENRKV